MKRTRVLWLIKGLGPGGAERLLVSMARVGDLARFEYETGYLLPHKTTFAPELERAGVPTFCFGRPGRDPAWPWRLRRLLRDGGYDVVHLHSPLLAGVGRIVVRTLPRSRRPAVVSTEHNVWNSYAWQTRLLNALLHQRDARRWAVSPLVRESMWRNFRPGVEVLTHGIVMSDASKVDDARVRIRDELGIGPEEVVAITVANFRPEKAYPDLLQAASIAFDRCPSLRLLIVGQGPLGERIEALHQELGLGDRCQILGYRADVMDLLAACDYFVIASHFEGFPIALMEAMAMGLPVVATRVGGVPEAVTHEVQGLLAEPREPEALAAAMVRMAEDTDGRAAMAGRARVEGQRFDIRSAVEVLERAYQEVANGAGSRAAARRGP